MVLCDDGLLLQNGSCLTEEQAPLARPQPGQALDRFPVELDLVTRRVRAVHNALLAAMHHLEAALLAPPDPVSGRQSILGHVHRLYEAVQSHVAAAESGAGLLDNIDIQRPALVRQVRVLLVLHLGLREQTGALLAQVASAGQAAPLDWIAVRRQVTALLDTLRRHLDRETDLIFESVYTDFGAGN